MSGSYTVTPGHRCPSCGWVQRVSKRVDDVPLHPIVTATLDRLRANADAADEGMRLHEVFGWLSAVAPELCDRFAVDFADTGFTPPQPVSEGASAPASRDLAEGQELDRSQPSETALTAAEIGELAADPSQITVLLDAFTCDQCERTSPTKAGIVAHMRSHAVTLAATGESGD